MERKSDDLFSPQLQSPVAIILILYKFFILVLRNALPIIILLIFNKGQQRDNFEILLVIIVSLISTTLSIAAYYKFRYHIMDDEIIINKGILKKVNLNVPFDRIQAINSNQNLIHRIFNVASIEIDTAGSKNSEIKIDAISIDKAKRLKEYILSQKALSVAIEDNEIKDVDSNQLIQEEKELLRLDIPALLKVGIGQNHFRSLSIIGLFFLGLTQYADMIFSKKEYMKYSEQLETAAMSFILIIAPLVLIATFIFTLFRTVLKYYDLRFKETNLGYRLVSGLFTRHEKQANFNKIQLVGWHTNPIKKWFGMFELNLSQAFSSTMIKKQTLQIPGMYADQLAGVCHSYFPVENRSDYILHPVSPRLMIRTFSKLGSIVFALGCFKVLNPHLSLSWMLILAALVLAVCYTYFSWKKWQIKISKNGILIRKGFISTSYILLRWEKIQGLRSRQSIFQMRHHLTDLHIFTAAGPLTVPYMSEPTVEELQDYLLYFVETNHAPWM